MVNGIAEEKWQVVERIKSGAKGWKWRRILEDGREGLGLMPRGQLDLEQGGMEKWLTSGLAPAQGVDVEDFCEDIEFTAHQAIGPVHVDWKGSFEEFDVTAIVGPADKDDQRLEASAGAWRN